MTEYKTLINEIENERQEKDELYKLLFTSDIRFINGYIQSILELVTAKYKTSDRLKDMLKKTVSTNNRAAKHALIFFTLFKEESFVNHFIHLENGEKIDLKKFSIFINDTLPEACDNLLQARFTNLQDFVETIRHLYVTV